MCCLLLYLFFFFFNDTATTEIYTLSLHDALPIFTYGSVEELLQHPKVQALFRTRIDTLQQQFAHYEQVKRFTLDRKSTRLNSSHANISYAVFCLKKKKKHRFKSIIK